MLLTAANHDLKWQPVRIDNGVDFCRQALHANVQSLRQRHF
jgi:hypothetical protein